MSVLELSAFALGLPTCLFASFLLGAMLRGSAERWLARRRLARARSGRLVDDLSAIRAAKARRYRRPL